MSSHRDYPERDSIKLVDLYVLVALSLALFGCFFTGITRAQQVASRKQTAENLRQVCLSTIVFSHQNNGAMPCGPSGFYPGNNREGSNSYGPCLFHILPHIDYDPEYKRSATIKDGKPFYTSWALRFTQCRAYRDSAESNENLSLSRTNYIANELALPAKRMNYPDSYENGTSKIVLYAEAYSLTADHFTWGGQYSSWNTDRQYWENPTWKPVPGSVPFQLAPSVKNASIFVPQSFGRDGLTVAMGDGSTKVVSFSADDQSFFRECTPTKDPLVSIHHD